MENNEHNLKFVLAMVLLFTLVPSFLAYFFLGFEVALIFAICLSTSFIITGIVGIENVIAIQLEAFHQKIKGYLTDIYSEMLKK